MNITEVKVVLTESRRSKLLGYASITIEDAFAIHDIRIIEGAGGTFVAMPSKPSSVYCSSCARKNYATSKFCVDCGEGLNPLDVEDVGPRGRSHVDIVHPINAECRDLVESVILNEYSRQVSQRNSGNNESNRSSNRKRRLNGVNRASI